MNNVFFPLLLSLLLFVIIFFVVIKSVNFYRRKYEVEIREILATYKNILDSQSGIRSKTNFIGKFHRKKGVIEFNLCEIVVTNDALIIFGEKPFIFTLLIEPIVLTLKIDDYAELLSAKSIFATPKIRVLKFDKLDFEPSDDSVYIETQVKDGISEDYLLKIRLYNVKENIKEILKKKIFVK